MTQQIMFLSVSNRSIIRIESFLCAEECYSVQALSPPEGNSLALELRGANLTWNGNDPILQDVNLQVPKGELIIISGR